MKSYIFFSTVSLLDSNIWTKKFWAVIIWAVIIYLGRCYYLFELLLFI